MKKQELFELRTTGELKFSTLEELISQIEKIMKNSQIPLVSGYKEFNPKESWGLVYLTPRELSDELTLKNFLEGVKKINKEIYPNNFFGEMNYNGVESMHYSNEGQSILEITIKEKAKSSRTYGLNITLEKNRTYGAKAIICPTKFEKSIEKHLGPNKNYF